MKLILAIVIIVVLCAIGCTATINMHSSTKINVEVNKKDKIEPTLNQK